MMDDRTKGGTKGGWKCPSRSFVSPDDPAEAISPGPSTPDEDLSEAVQRVQRHELERRIERLTAETGRLKRDLASLVRFRTFIDRAGEAVYLIESETGKFVDVNETGLRWLGLPRSHLLTMTVDDLDLEFPLQYPDSPVEHIANTRNVDRPWVFGGGVHRRRDGSSFPVEVAVSRRRFVNRDYVLVVARETNSRTRTERRLREVEETYRTIFDFTCDAFYLTTRDGLISEVNQAAIDILEYTREELLGRPARDLYNDKRHVKAFQEAVEENGIVCDLPVSLRTKQGTSVSGLLTATSRHAGDGTIAGYQCLIRISSARG